MRQARLAIIALGCLVVGPVLLVRSFTALPAKDELIEISGPVQFDTEMRSTRFTRTRYLVLLADGIPFKYLDWFPKSEGLTSLVRGGEQITILTDKGKNNWVWQITRDGETVIAYADVHSAVSSNRRFERLTGSMVVLLAAVASVFLLRQRKQEKEQSASDSTQTPSRTMTIATEGLATEVTEECPWCEAQVIPTSDGLCSSCNRPIS